MKKISSRQNPEINALAALKTAQERYKQNRFLAEGIRVCSTLIASKRITLLQLYVLESLVEQAHMFVDPSLMTVITQPVLQKISQTTTPSGIVGVFALPKEPSPTLLDEGIVLNNISDPGNMGTLIRTCAGIGKKTVVLIEGVDPWNLKVIQASAGAIGSMNIFCWSWQELIKYKKDLMLVGLVPQSGESIENISQKSLLIIGSEAHGIHEEHLKQCDKKVSLTMPGGIESLNAAVAGSIAMYLAWSRT